MDGIDPAMCSAEIFAAMERLIDEQDEALDVACDEVFASLKRPLKEAILDSFSYHLVSSNDDAGRVLRMSLDQRKIHLAAQFQMWNFLVESTAKSVSSMYKIRDALADTLPLCSVERICFHQTKPRATFVENGGDEIAFDALAIFVEVEVDEYLEKKLGRLQTDCITR